MSWIPTRFMNKVLDSREPTLSTGSLWLPRVPSGRWGEELTATTLRVHELYVWHHSFAAEGHGAQDKQRTQMKWRRKILLRIGAQCIMIKSSLKNHLSSQGSAPNPRTGQSRGFIVIGVFSIPQLQCSAILWPETQQARGSFASMWV